MGHHTTCSGHLSQMDTPLKNYHVAPSAEVRSSSPSTNPIIERGRMKFLVLWHFDVTRLTPEVVRANAERPKYGGKLELTESRMPLSRGGQPRRSLDL